MIVGWEGSEKKINIYYVMIMCQTCSVLFPPPKNAM